MREAVTERDAMTRALELAWRGTEPVRLPTGEVGDRMVVSREPDVTRLLVRMEGHGLVARERRANNRRFVNVRITREGLRVLKALDAPVSMMHRRQLEHMTRRGWSLNGLHRPAAVHLCVTLRHTEPGVAERFLADLRASVAEALSQPADNQGLAPVYGLAATLPFRGMVRDLLKKYIDLLYRP